MAALKDAVLDSAIDLAREAAVAVAERSEDVGEHLGVVRESERLVSHTFATTAKGYRGWRWTVTLARVPRGRTATVCEVELLPGDDALRPQPWLPWDERLRPGDVGPGDVLPFRADDPRLEPGWTPSGDPEVDEVAIGELALARARVLSQDGIAETATRWYQGSRGPTAPVALASTSPCQTCGFIVPLSGSLGQLFGVCTNEWSPDDGKVVSLDHGCGAHSETDVEQRPSEWPAPSAAIDDEDVVMVDRGRPTSAGTATDAGTATATDAAATADTVIDSDSDSGSDTDLAEVGLEQVLTEEQGTDAAPEDGSHSE